MSILKYEEETMWELWPVIVIGAIVAYMMLRVRETFVIRYGNPFDNEDVVSFDPKERKGTRLFSTTPHTCPENKLDLQDGLCYEPCASGYNGVGPVCWAETQNIGVGTLAGLQDCNAPKELGGMGLSGYRNDPLTCWKDLKCETTRSDTWSWTDGGFFRTKCEGPDLKARTLYCPGPGQGAAVDFLTSILSGSLEKINIKDYTDLVDGLCYRKCPADKPNRVPGQPYLCYRALDANTGVSYGRGEGTVPPLFHFGA